MNKFRYKIDFMPLVLFSQLMASFVLYYIKSRIDISVPGSLILNSTFSFVVPIFLYKLISGKKFTELLMLNPLSFKNIGYILAITLFMYPMMNSVAGFSSLFFKNYVSDTIMELKGYSFYYIAFSLAVIPAVLEEAAFRGVLFSQYKNMNIIKAALLNGLFFGLVHLNLQQFSYAFFIGFIFSILVSSTKSIYSSVIAHFVINFTSCCISYIGLNDNGLQSAVNISTKEMLISLIAIFILTVFPFTYILNKFISYNKKALNNLNDFDISSRKLINPLFILTVLAYIYLLIINSF